jgi:hypothetical protein
MQSAANQSQQGKFPESREICREFLRLAGKLAIGRSKKANLHRGLWQKFPTRRSREIMPAEQGICQRVRRKAANLCG